jgi:succinate dehydrogenase / fumarate reductase cytochrome b subunit
LLHGFYSAFKTLGVYNKRYLVLVRWTGYVFAVVVSLTFAMMPVSFYLGWVK